MMDIWVLKSACSKQEDSVFWPGISNDICKDCGKNVEFVKQVPGQPKPVGNVSGHASSCMAHFGHRSVSIGAR